MWLEVRRLRLLVLGWSLRVVLLTPTPRVVLVLVAGVCRHVRIAADALGLDGMDPTSHIALVLPLGLLLMLVRR